LALSRVPEKPTRRYWIWTALAVPAAAAAALMIALPVGNRGSAEDDPSFVARGSDRRDANRWISLEVLHIAEDGGRYARVAGTIEADEPLVFSVKNNVASPYRFLMVFGVQSTGAIYWYYPAYTAPGQNPKSVGIGASAEFQPLGEEIRHQLSPGWLLIVALFTEKPVDVETVERLVAQALSDQKSVENIGDLQIQNAGQMTKLLRVEQSRQR
jgi:hypothetical protein